MATHLGRNPFQIKLEKAKRTQNTSGKTKEKGKVRKSESASTPISNSDLSSESLLVKIPAASAVLALKTLFFVKGLIQKE